jgi:hypothetical protein
VVNSQIRLIRAMENMMLAAIPLALISRFTQEDFKDVSNAMIIWQAEMEGTAVSVESTKKQPINV